MRFVADESLDQQIVEALQGDGHEVWSVAEMDPGLSDEAVLDLARREGALLMTADKDFGELVFRQRRLSSGVVPVRLFGLPLTAKAATVVSAIAKHAAELPQAFTVVLPGLVRIRRQIL